MWRVAYDKHGDNAREAFLAALRHVGIPEGGRIVDETQAETAKTALELWEPDAMPNNEDTAWSELLAYAQAPDYAHGTLPGIRGRIERTFAVLALLGLDGDINEELTRFAAMEGIDRVALSGMRKPQVEAFGRWVQAWLRELLETWRRELLENVDD